MLWGVGRVQRPVGSTHRTRPSTTRPGDASNDVYPRVGVRGGDGVDGVAKRGPIGEELSDVRETVRGRSASAAAVVRCTPMPDEPLSRDHGGAANTAPTGRDSTPDRHHRPQSEAARGDLDRLYESRFSRDEAAAKDRVWVEICLYLQRFVSPGAPVLDVAADRGHFINNITAPERWATDIRDVRHHLETDVRFVQVTGTEMSRILPNDYFGTVFMSNYLEHLADSDVVVTQLKEAHAVCRAGGRVVILQPNIRLVGGAYWDFLDHHTALTEKSLVEAAELAGFTHSRVITRFLPFTTKSRLPRAPTLVRWYLRCPPAWLVLGKQTLYIGERAYEDGLTSVSPASDGRA